MTALVGESGSGKSVIGQSIMGILPRVGTIASGTITFNDPARPGDPVEIEQLLPSGPEMRSLRGGRTGHIGHRGYDPDLMNMPQRSQSNRQLSESSSLRANKPKNSIPNDGRIQTRNEERNGTLEQSMAELVLSQTNALKRKMLEQKTWGWFARDELRHKSTGSFQNCTADNTSSARNGTAPDEATSRYPSL